MHFSLPLRIIVALNLQ